jgi:beta-glucosidase
LTNVTFEIYMSQLAFLDEDMRWRVEAGIFELRVGGASDRIELTKAFEVTGTRIIDGPKRAFYAKVASPVSKQ